jgi:hypothetical protein
MSAQRDEGRIRQDPALVDLTNPFGLETERVLDADSTAAQKRVDRIRRLLDGVFDSLRLSVPIFINEQRSQTCDMR